MQVTTGQYSLISICIPAYKRTAFLKRLLDSIAIQTYRHIEVIITDDSPDNSVSELCNTYASQFPLQYYRNATVAGSPGNWNNAIDHAKGDWIKLMHDDDWFATAGSLEAFVVAAKNNPGTDFIFSSYTNVYDDGRPSIIIHSDAQRRKAVFANAVTLLAGNCIGPPSVVLYKSTTLRFDTRLTWLVDIDFYMLFLKDGRKALYINQPLVNIGVNAEQVTKQSALVREVELPEHFLVLQKTGVQHLRNIWVYDAWWRLFRNLRIRQVNELAPFTATAPLALVRIIYFQRNFPTKLLRIGILSKALMCCCYVFNAIAGSGTTSKRLHR